MCNFWLVGGALFEVLSHTHLMNAGSLKPSAFYRLILDGRSQSSMPNASLLGKFIQYPR